MLVNKELAGKDVATEFGPIKFDENGECKDLKADQEKKLGALPGFEFVEEKKEAPKQKTEEKKEAKPAPKKAAAKK
jgi:hypothetical protein